MVNKPYLRTKILRLLIQNDKLSKTGVMNKLLRNDHGNISDGCDWLAKQGFIKLCLISPHGGRPENYYEITKKGITYLIENSEKPTEFWNSLMFLVYWRGNDWNLKALVDLLDTYLKGYLTYYLNQGYYSFQLDSFNLACKVWFEKAILSSGKISPGQKVIEVLAVNPGITPSKLAQISGEKVATVKSIIKMYTTIPHQPVTVDIQGHYDGTFYNVEDWRFQIHKAIVQFDSNNGVTTLSLSLFGVLMVLYIIMKNHSASLPQGLMYTYELQHYFEIIVKNYRLKIPLIFEKWLLLKSFLGKHTCLNFGPILDKNLREESFQYPLRNRGNKELYLGMKETIYTSQRQLVELRNAGMNVFYNFSPDEGYTNPHKTNTNRNAVMDKTLSVFHLLLYLITLIQPTDFDSKSFVSMFGNQNYVGPKVAEQISSLFDIEHLERNLAHEICFIYLLSLKIGKVFSYEDPLVHYDQILSKLLGADKEISSFFNEHVGKIKRYYEELYKAVRII